MEDLHWPLSVLTRCIHYKNISLAAQNIGISQPQISRLVKRIEQELDIIILDKSSPRHSKWTQAAFNLVEIYTRNTRALENSLNQLKVDQIPKSLAIGSLEGLTHQALDIIHRLQNTYNFNEIHLDIYDQNEMEGHFLFGELDLILTSRIPGKRKPKFIKSLGFQTLEQVKNDGLQVLSPFEFQTKKSTHTNKLISNSLYARKYWLEHYGGKGQIPGPVKKKRDKNDLEVLLIAKESFHQKVWDVIQ
jgi:molybdenum-dependent DNA-binding transcriptional regulator ModE